MQAPRDGRKFAASLHIIVANNNINEATIIGQKRRAGQLWGFSIYVHTYIEPCAHRSIL